jgi:hypothetical protein
MIPDRTMGGIASQASWLTNGGRLPCVSHEGGAGAAQAGWGATRACRRPISFWKLEAAVFTNVSRLAAGAGFCLGRAWGGGGGGTLGFLETREIIGHL